MARTALVTGGNRGIGLETCRGLAKAGLHVLLASRDAALGKAAAADLKAQGLDVEAVTLDVAQPSSIQACVDGLTSRGVQVDVLVNNAGIYPEPGILDGDPALLTEALQVHVVGPAHLCRLLMPAMNARGYGRVVNVSSGLGAFSDGMQGGAAYCISKAAMNALTMCVAQEAKGDVTVNAMCPGWHLFNDLPPLPGQDQGSPGRPDAILVGVPTLGASRIPYYLRGDAWPNL